jgi:hypothetical protein
MNWYVRICNLYKLVNLNLFKIQIHITEVVYVICIDLSINLQLVDKTNKNYPSPKKGLPLEPRYTGMRTFSTK